MSKDRSPSFQKLRDANNKSLEGTLARLLAQIQSASLKTQHRRHLQYTDQQFSLLWNSHGQEKGSHLTVTYSPVDTNSRPNTTFRPNTTIDFDGVVGLALLPQNYTQSDL